MCAYEHNLRVISHELAMLNVKSKRYQCSSKASQFAGPPTGIPISLAVVKTEKKEETNLTQRLIQMCMRTHFANAKHT